MSKRPFDTIEVTFSSVDLREVFLAKYKERLVSSVFKSEGDKITAHLADFYDIFSPTAE